MPSTLVAYLIAALVMGLLDALWLGLLARDFYQREIGSLMRPTPLWQPALLFYLGYPLGLLGLALTPWPMGLGQALWRSALLGAVAYGAYDLTNLAVLKGFGWRVALVDMAWGIFASAAAGGAAYAVVTRWR